MWQGFGLGNWWSFWLVIFLCNHFCVTTGKKFFWSFYAEQFWGIDTLLIAGLTESPQVLSASHKLFCFRFRGVPFRPCRIFAVLVFRFDGFILCLFGISRSHPLFYAKIKIVWLADKTCGLFKNILFSCVKTNVAFTALHNVKDFVLNAGRIINSKINVCMTTTKIRNCWGRKHLKEILLAKLLMLGKLFELFWKSRLQFFQVCFYFLRAPSSRLDHHFRNHYWGGGGGGRP